MTAMTASSVDCDHANLTDRVIVAGVDHHSTVAEFWNGLTPTSIKCDGQPFQKTMVRTIENSPRVAMRAFRTVCELAGADPSYVAR